MQGVDLNGRDANGWTALHHCAYLGGHTRFRLAKDLLDAGAAVDIETTSKRTALHLACIRKANQESKSQFVTLLVANGAATEIRDEKVTRPAGNLSDLNELPDVVSVCHMHCAPRGTSPCIMRPRLGMPTASRRCVSTRSTSTAARPRATTARTSLWPTAGNALSTTSAR